MACQMQVSSAYEGIDCLVIDSSPFVADGIPSFFKLIHRTAEFYLETGKEPTCSIQRYFNFSLLHILSRC